MSRYAAAVGAVEGECEWAIEQAGQHPSDYQRGQRDLADKLLEIIAQRLGER